MTQKPPSVNVGASDETTAKAPAESEHSGGDAIGGEPEESKAASESYDDSLEAILLQASARPPEPAASKMLGSKTLMGIGMEALNLSAILASARNKGESETESDAESAGRTDVQPKANAAVAEEAKSLTETTSVGEAPSAEDAKPTADRKAVGGDQAAATPAATFLMDDPSAVSAVAALGTGEADGKTEELAKTEAKLAATIGSGGVQTNSLLDDVAQALNVQASEYRDRARGRLPGMPSANMAAPNAALAKAGAGRTDVEFEDPDDGPTALTPGMIAVVEATGVSVSGVEAEDVELGSADPSDDDDESVVLGPSAAASSVPTRPMAVKSEVRAGPVPPVPGHPVTVAAVVGPPPGVPARTATPAAGLAIISPIGRVHLPTPMAGLPAPTVPSPGVGRMTLPLGSPSPSLGAFVDPDLTATSPSTPISLEASRRVASAISGMSTTSSSGASGPVVAGSGRVSAGSGPVPGRRGSGRITEPVFHAVSAFPAVLTAHVKLATASLAGLIAVTFAGGLLVGMLVWKGQGRNDAPTARVAAAPPTVVAPSPAPAASPPPAAAPAPTTPPTAEAANARAAVPPAATTAAATPPPPINNHPAAESASAAAISEPAALPTEAIVTPLGGASESLAAASEAPPVEKPARHASRPSRTKAAVVAVAAEAPVAVKTAAPKPAIRPAVPSASKPMAANGGAKSVTKSKAKAAWHDPFAD